MPSDYNTLFRRDPGGYTERRSCAGNCGGSFEGAGFYCNYCGTRPLCVDCKKRDRSLPRELKDKIYCPVCWSRSESLRESLAEVFENYKHDKDALHTELVMLLDKAEEPANAS